MAQLIHLLSALKITKSFSKFAANFLTNKLSLQIWLVLLGTYNLGLVVGAEGISEGLVEEFEGGDVTCLVGVARDLALGSIDLFSHDNKKQLHISANPN